MWLHMEKYWDFIDAAGAACFSASAECNLRKL
jgi:hypothetical protein